MKPSLSNVLLLATAMGLPTAGVARADCESDLIQLENAYKTPNLSPAAKAALDDAKTKSVSAMKKDDDAGCHKAIGDALPKAGLSLK